MDTWITVTASVVSAVGGAGILQGVNSWIKARAKKLSDEGDAVKTKAETDAKTREAETTAKIKTMEAEAAMDHALAEEIRALRADHNQCQEDRKKDREACEAELEEQKRWMTDQITTLRTQVEALAKRVPA